MGSPPIPRTTQAHHTSSAPTLSQSRHRGGGREWEPRVGILLTTVTLFLVVPTKSRLPSAGFRGSSPPTIQMGARRWSRWRRAPLLGPGWRCLLQSVGLRAQGAAPTLSRAPGASPVRQGTAELPRRLSLCGHPGAALSVRGPSPKPGRHRPLSPWGSAHGAWSQCPPGLPVYFRSGGAPRVFYSGVSTWAPRGGPANAGPFPRAGTGLSLPSTGLHTRSTTPAPSRASEAHSAESAAETPSQPPFYFSLPSEPVGPRR
ncbi:hypothetical protein NDU88_004994 [Pleurodeles waltl]|uniref:Uncharacterized protein n=1 Tax=Pleurodeles waltl TaxID=8319 RepID=A0AAV7RHR9_PLEWA|nr:hypothetical protein NDU88_004994 [Pleurodeles waltl]